MKFATMFCALVIVAATANAAGQTPAHPIDTIADVLQESNSFLFNLGNRARIEQEISASERVVRKQMAWSAEKGALLLVSMKKDRFGHQPAQLSRVEQLGFGPSPYEVLVMSLDERRVTEPTENFDPNSSFFVWIKRDGKGFRRLYLPPGSFNPLVERAKTDQATRDLLKQLEPMQRHKNLLAMANEGVRSINNAQAKKALRDAYRDINQNRQEQEKIDQQLEQALDDQRRIAGATAWLNSLEKAVAVAALSTQIQAMLGPEAPRSIMTDVKNALTTGQLKDALKTYETERAAIIPTLQNEKAAVDLIYYRRARFIIDTVGPQAPPMPLP